MANYNTTSGNHTFNDEIRVDEIKNNAGTGAPDFPNGISIEGQTFEKTTKWQTKFLSSTVNVTGSGITNVSDFTFNNLQIGKTYRITLNGRIDLNPSTGATEQVILVAKHNGNAVASIEFRQDDSASDNQRIGVAGTGIFTATATSLTVDLVHTCTNGTLQTPNVSHYSSAATIEELPSHAETSDFT